MKIKMYVILIFVTFFTLGCISTPNIEDEDVILSEDRLLDILIAPLDEFSVTFTHTILYEDYSNGDFIDRGEIIGQQEPWPEVLSEKNDEILKSAMKSYHFGDYGSAYNILSSIHEDEKENLFYLYYLAKTLFWFNGESFKNMSKEYFLQIQQNIEDNYPYSEENTIVIDAWFQDVYWKIACFYLDDAEYEKAALEIAKTSLLGYKGNPKAFEDILSYSTEIYYFLGNREYNQFLYLYTKAQFPENRYVDRFRL